MLYVEQKNYEKLGDIRMNESAKIDFLDVKILNALQKNARVTKTKLSEDIGLSATPCHLRIKKLEEKGYITDYFAEVDYTVFGGYSFYWVEIHLKNYSTEIFTHFEKTITAIPEILECIATLGKVDYLIKIAAKTVQSYQEIIENLVQTEGLDIDYTTFPMVKQVKTPRESTLISDYEAVVRKTT